ncbi:hypothetical protein RCH23_003289 [Cryobacterium sp. CAN_C3]|uniref:hypothetical protein n=1 Tax=unclassified Cryobacterium TaxID=2649013 RepID=UPI001A19DE65|nr:hypothetical protein [Cryobacterium sp. CAN_C3]
MKPRNRAPLRESGFRIASQLAGVVIGLVVVLVFLPQIIGGQVKIPWWAFVAGSVLGVAIAVAATIVGLLLGRRLVGDRIEGAVREPGSKWRHGRLEVGGDAIVFERYRFQLRIPSGVKQRFDDVILGEDTGRRPPFRQLWTINPQLHIVSLDAQQGHFEFAAMPSQIQELRDRLHEPLPQ